MRSTFISSLPLMALLAAVPATAQQQAQEESGRNVNVSPYIEVSQILVAELSPGDEVLTYTQLAAGIAAL